MAFRPYDSARDQQAVLRVWQETNWLQEERAERLDYFIQACGGGWVAEVNGEAECVVLRSPGDLRYLDETLPFTCITAVTTSRIARQRSLAGRLTATAVAHEAAAGAAVVGLGMFDQGFYNRLGFGNGAYEHSLTLNPATLTVDFPPRVPQRLTKDDYQAIHACRLRRRREHGSVSLTAPEFTLGRIEMEGGGYGLGYRDEADGGLSHMLWATNHHAYHGPLEIRYLLYQTKEQLLELLALIKSLGDQIYSVRLTEPTHVQLQDLIRQPFAQHTVTEGGKYPVAGQAYAWWQMRICDLAACLRQTHLPGEGVRFNLRLEDPIAEFLAPDAPWGGVGGSYVVSLGPKSEARPGTDPGLPTLRASVGAFTRLWLGVRPASGLTVTDDLAGPPELLADLDRLLRLPPPRADWDM